MFVQQFFVKGIAHSSYLLGGKNSCAVVDPRRDVDIYIEAAKEMGMSITHVLETHLHADFISGHLELQEKTGAVICAPKAGKCAFKHTAVSDGYSFKIEDMTLTVLETPGHTPEHVSYAVRDLSRGNEPVAVFCGDTLFVGDVGRPDLFPGIAEDLAGKLFDSLNRKLLKLPDFCEVYPAHGAGSLCGRAMGAKRWSTIGYERKYNMALTLRDRKKFIKSLTTNMPPAPDHFSRCSAINRKGPALIRKLPSCVPIDPAGFYKRSLKKNTIVLDIRSYDAFGGQHVPGSYNIDWGGNFATFAGWILPADHDIILVADSPHGSSEALVLLRRVGLDRTAGFLDGGMHEWAKAGLPIETVFQISAKELQARIKNKNAPFIVDVRAKGEYDAYHIDGSLNIPVPDLRTRHDELGTYKEIAVICNTGLRSSLAASILKRKLNKNIYNIPGGMTAWNASRQGPECALCVKPHGPQNL